MINRTTYIFSITVIILGLSFPAFGAADGTLDDNEAYLVELINQVRTIKELPVFEVDAFLTEKADYNNDIEPVDDKEPFAVLLGNDYLKTGETGGGVTFFNFMAPDDASKIVVKNQLNNELDTGSTDERFFLSSDYDLIGVSFKAGTYKSGKTTMRGYFITICFASRALKSERQILNVINQVRANPSTIVHYLKEDPASLLNDNWNTYPELSGAYAPLFYNDILFQTTQDYFELSDEYREYDPLIRAGWFDYEGVELQEAVGITKYRPNDEDIVPINEIISDILVAELDSPPGVNILFDGNADESAVGLEFSFGKKWTTITSVTEVGQRAAEDVKIPRIYGVVFLDDDENGVYTPGEEIDNKKINIYDNRTHTLQKRVYSDSAGSFAAELEAAAYIISVTKGKKTKKVTVYLTNDIFVPINMSDL